jgi:uncharacterized membrane protein
MSICLGNQKSAVRNESRSTGWWAYITMFTLSSSGILQGLRNICSPLDSIHLGAILTSSQLILLKARADLSCAHNSESCKCGAQQNKIQFYEKQRKGRRKT